MATCVIWCVKMLFWHLVFISIVLIVTVVWGYVRCGGASPEDVYQTHLGTMMMDKEVISAGYLIGC